MPRETPTRQSYCAVRIGDEAQSTPRPRCSRHDATFCADSEKRAMTGARSGLLTSHGGSFYKAGIAKILCTIQSDRRSANFWGAAAIALACGGNNIKSRIFGAAAHGAAIPNVTYGTAFATTAGEILPSGSRPLLRDRNHSQALYLLAKLCASLRPHRAITPPISICRRVVAW